MNKLKFRAWYKEGNTMHYDCLPLGGWDHWWIAFDNDKKYDGEFEVGKDIEVMQFTRLKDKNGVEIYDGDILDITYGKWYGERQGLRRFGTVVYSTKEAKFAIKIKDSAVEIGFGDSKKHDIEVIGNIYESQSNPHIATQDER